MPSVSRDVKGDTAKFKSKKGDILKSIALFIVMETQVCYFPKQAIEDFKAQLHKGPVNIMAHCTLRVHGIPEACLQGVAPGKPLESLVRLLGVPLATKPANQLELTLEERTATWKAGKKDVQLVLVE